MADRPDIITVLLDGKRVPNPIAFDTAEGWVDSLVPLPPKLNREDDIVELDEEEVKWEVKRAYGSVISFLFNNKKS